MVQLKGMMGMAAALKYKHLVINTKKPNVGRQYTDPHGKYTVFQGYDLIFNHFHYDDGRGGTTHEFLTVGKTPLYKPFDGFNIYPAQDTIDIKKYPWLGYGSCGQIKPKLK